MVFISATFIVIIIILFYAFKEFINWRYHARIKRNISWYGLISLALLYFTIALGFSSIFLILEILGFKVLYSTTALPLNNSLDYLLNLIYFSMTTLFSIGYGEWVPIGIGKLIAVLEGLIGYLLPPAFIISYIYPYQRKR